MADQGYQVAAAQTDDGRSAEELVAAYAAGAATLRESLAGMDAEALRARPIEGMWSSLEVLCHLADCEQFLADRMKRAIGTDKPLVVGIDPSPYTTRLHYHDRDPELQLRLVDVTREQMAADLGRMAPDDWQRQAVHTETGLVTVRQLLFHTVRHLEWHVATIREKRAALGIA
jgi:uncharacterized damage-inducible protein DinB